MRVPLLLVVAMAVLAGCGGGTAGEPPGTEVVIEEVYTDSPAAGSTAPTETTAGGPSGSPATSSPPSTAADGTDQRDQATGTDEAAREATERTRDGDERDGLAVFGSDIIVYDDYDGNIEADGAVLVTAGAEVEGHIQAAADVGVEPGGEVDGNIEAGGDISIGRGSEIDGDVEADGRVIVGPGAEVDGNVAGASVEVADSAEIDGRITRRGG